MALDPLSALGQDFSCAWATCSSWTWMRLHSPPQPLQCAFPVHNPCSKHQLGATETFYFTLIHSWKAGPRTSPPQHNFSFLPEEQRDAEPSTQCFLAGPGTSRLHHAPRLGEHIALGTLQPQVAVLLDASL